MIIMTAITGIIIKSAIIGLIIMTAIIWMIIMDLDDNLGQDELEQRHQELLARQRQLQEQYQVGFPWFV